MWVEQTSLWRRRCWWNRQFLLFALMLFRHLSSSCLLSGPQYLCWNRCGMRISYLIPPCISVGNIEHFSFPLIEANLQNSKVSISTLVECKLHSFLCLKGILQIFEALKCGKIFVKMWRHHTNHRLSWHSQLPWSGSEVVEHQPRSLCGSWPEPWLWFWKPLFIYC